MGILGHRPNVGLEVLEELFESGEVVPVLDRRYPLQELADALRYFGEGHHKGKKDTTRASVITVGGGA